MKTWLTARSGSLIALVISTVISTVVSASSFTDEALNVEASQAPTFTVSDVSQQMQPLDQSQRGGGGGNHYYYYSFGQVPIDRSQHAHFTLTNNGNQPMHIKYVRLYGYSFHGNSNCPNILSPGSRCDAWIEFRPWTEGGQDGQLIFATNAGNFIINLYGWGARW